MQRDLAPPVSRLDAGLRNMSFRLDLIFSGSGTAGGAPKFDISLILTRRKFPVELYFSRATWFDDWVEVVATLAIISNEGYV